MTRVIPRTRAYLRHIGTGLAVGVVFGVALEKGKVFLPVVIRQQFLFTHFQMLNMFLAAMAVSALVIAALEATGLAQRPAFPPTTLTGTSHGYGGNVLGGLLLGAGMAISGACPGTVFAQLGAGVQNAWLVLVGAALGAALFGLAQPLLRTRNARFHTTGQAKTLDGVLRVPFHVVALALAAVVAVLLLAINSLHSWRNDMRAVLQLGTADDLDAVVWHPILAGVVLGLLQGPAFLIVKTGLGASTSYVTVCGYCAQLFSGSLPDHSYFAEFMDTPIAFWQVAEVVGITLGSFWSAQTSGVQLRELGTAVAQTSRAQALLGGTLLVFGARLAQGCTSGHGITGSATSSVASLVSTCSMFAGAIATTLLLF